MQKRGKLLIPFLLIAMLFVTACSGGGTPNSPRDTAATLQQISTGTQGVELSLLRDLPPPTVYDDNQLTAIVEIRNRGNHDVLPQACSVQISGFDPQIIRGGINAPRSCAEGVGTLEGKSLYNPEGGMNQIEFTSSAITLPRDVNEYSPTLNILACYNYESIANPVVCIDPQLYDVTGEQKSCIPRDVSLGGGQAGPVGVSHVKVDMVSRKAIFEIDVQNYGGAKVLSPNTQVAMCGRNAQFSDLDKVGYQVTLGGNHGGDCKPNDGFVRLTNGRGKIVCSFDIQPGPAYETPLTIKLDYNYIDSISKQVRIVSTPR